MNKDRWQRLIMALGIVDGDDTYDALVAAYAEKHRRYHTTQHIEDCLSKLDIARHIVLEPAEVEIALWFHDAIYDPYASGNEEKSAQWAWDFLTRNAVDSGRVERIREHILATRHQSTATNLDSQLLVDIDLSILGATPSDYALFEKNVREEYKWVPGILFRKKRAEILQSFLDRPQIYSTAFFCNRYEKLARSNLQSAVTALTA